MDTSKIPHPGISVIAAAMVERLDRALNGRVAAARSPADLDAELRRKQSIKRRLAALPNDQIGLAAYTFLRQLEVADAA